MQPFWAPVAQPPRQLTRVDVGDGDRALSRSHSGSVSVAAEVGRALRHVAHDQPGRLHRRRLGVLLVDAGVADVRIGQRDDLAAIARVGQDLLVAGQRGVEDDLADGVTADADGDAFEHRAVGEREQGQSLL